MTERGLPIVGGAPACPFVAFEDDRDERATSPDHRHRCYAEAQPAPRALAHQEAYCLASAFPVCPTFQDWARREAARARPPDVPPAMLEDDEEEEDDGLPPLVEDRPPRRGSRGAWAAPPPWLRGAGSTTPPAAPPDQPPSTRSGGPEHDDRAAGAAAPGGGGLSGSFADRLIADRGMDAEAWDEELAGPRAGAGERVAYVEEAGDEDEAIAAGPPPTRRRERSDSGSDRMDGLREHDVGAPSWERPRRLEAYPTLRSRRWSTAALPSVLLGLLALVLAVAALVFIPQLFGGGGPGPSPSPGSSAGGSVEPSGETAAPSEVPAATPFLYTVQQGDTLTKIAKKFGVDLNALIDANRTTLPNPDVLKVGQVLIIPTATPTELPGASAASTP